ncbi:MAG: conjugal transfer protein TraG N-terminal domain-containing protein [Exilibacterium sp.]
MAVDSTLELYTTLFGWLFYNSVWEVLTATGIVFLPFLGILLDTAIKTYAGEDGEDAGNTSLRMIESEFFVAFFVVMLTGVPALPLSAADLSFTPKALIGNAGQPVASVDDSQTTYGGTLSFVDYPNQVDLPVFWYAVLSFASGFNRAVMEDVPVAIDLREYANQLRTAKISDPALQAELNDFFRDCFIEARSKYLAERPGSAQIGALLTTYGPTDPDWVGSHVYQEVTGFYDTLRSDSIRQGFVWSQLRDLEWEVDNHPIYGKPYCNEWWNNAALGLATKILNQTQGLELVAAAAEPGWDETKRRDAIIKAAMLNSPPRWTTRGYDFAYGDLIADNADGNGVLASAQNLAEQGLAVYGLARESISLAAYLRIFLEGAPMLQALILMGLYALLPFFILMSRYRLSIFIIGALILFIVKFWTVLWFFAWWVDKNLIKAFYPDPGDLTTLSRINLRLPHFRTGRSAKGGNNTQ